MRQFSSQWPDLTKAKQISKELRRSDGEAKRRALEIDMTTLDYGQSTCQVDMNAICRVHAFISAHMAPETKRVGGHQMAASLSRLIYFEYAA